MKLDIVFVSIRFCRVGILNMDWNRILNMDWNHIIEDLDANVANDNRANQNLGKTHLFPVFFATTSLLQTSVNGLFEIRYHTFGLIEECNGVQ